MYLNLSYTHTLPRLLTASILRPLQERAHANSEKPPMKGPPVQGGRGPIPLQEGLRSRKPPESTKKAKAEDLLKKAMKARKSSIERRKMGKSGYDTLKPERSYMVSTKKNEDRDKRKDELQSLVKNVSGSTSVRRHVKESEDVELNVTFNHKEFFVSMLYETLPPIIFSPLAACLIEGPRRAYHLINHRLFLPIDTSYNKIGLIIVFWVAIIPMLYLLNVGVFLFVWHYKEVSSKIDTWEVVLAYVSSAGGRIAAIVVA